ncbi:MBL fold metallo-hydrolase [Kribbella speibonae]|uniref:MBL fold metallo-hydrolase n=1 Tax=Kribbella speibonae TaxID=1572660 RepID=A0ABY2A8Z4_9ACTN|nr:MBL fold metallo-hydrolase [Kribbella speibonae]TCC24716.1 MBL fold metallo-hydrolase [Kribbella speibonae]
MRGIGGSARHAAYEFGGLTVVALLDGYIDLPPSRLRDERGGVLSPLPGEVPLVDGRLRLSVNAFLVDDGERRVLVDTGASNSWDPTMGELPEGMRVAGIDRELITDVAITHTHVDHVNGLVAADGSDAFPLLERIFVGAGDVRRFDGNLARFRDRVVPVAEELAVTPWMTALPTVGHTPGHTTYDVRDGDGHLLIWGDTIHVPSLQFAHPEVCWELDDDQTLARAGRAALLDRLTRPRHFVAGAHLDWPGIGRVTQDGLGYAVEYLSCPTV